MAGTVVEVRHHKGSSRRAIGAPEFDAAGFAVGGVVNQISGDGQSPGTGTCGARNGCGAAFSAVGHPQIGRSCAIALRDEEEAVPQYGQIFRLEVCGRGDEWHGSVGGSVRLPKLITMDPVIGGEIDGLSKGGEVVSI